MLAQLTLAQFTLAQLTLAQLTLAQLTLVQLSAVTGTPEGPVVNKLLMVVPVFALFVVFPFTAARISR